MDFETFFTGVCLMSQPEIKHLHGALYLVPFELIELPEPEMGKDGYEFHNPRAITDKGQSELTDAESSESLRNDIVNKTLMTPLICRFGKKGKIQLVGGERRYRALSYLMQKQVMVRDPQNIINNKDGSSEYGWRAANHVYESVPCQVYKADDDLEALAFSYSENENRQNFNSGHDVAMMLELRRKKVGDDRILTILQKTKAWMRDTDELVKSLDPKTLGDLIEGRIDRVAAQKLSMIDDLSERKRILEEAKSISEVRNEQRQATNVRVMDKANREMTLAEMEMVAANASGDKSEVKEAAKHVQKASAMIADAMARGRQSSKSTGSRDVDIAIRKRMGPRVPKPDNRSLSQGKVKKYLEFLADLKGKQLASKKTGFDIPETMERGEVIEFVTRVVRGIHDCEEDLGKIMKKCFPA